MNVEPDDLTPEARRAREALKALPPAKEPADADFRARLRAGFIGGTLVSTVPEPRDPDRSRVLRLARPAVWVPLAAAAVLAIVIAVVAGTPAWEVIAVNGIGDVRIDGAAVSSSARADLARRLHGGAHVQLAEGVSLDLVAPGQLAMHFSAGSDVRLTAPPRRWGARRAEVRIDRGEVFVSTGAAFRGAGLAVITPEARVDVRGTQFAVMRFAHGTCVCVLEGRVQVGSMFDSTSAEVVQGQRRFCYPSQPAYTDSILESSVHELHRLQDVSGLPSGR